MEKNIETIIMVGLHDAGRRSAVGLLCGECDCCLTVFRLIATSLLRVTCFFQFGLENVDAGSSTQFELGRCPKCEQLQSSCCGGAGRGPAAAASLEQCFWLSQVRINFYKIAQGKG